MNNSISERPDQEGFIRLSLVQPFLDQMQVRKVSAKQAFLELGVDEASVVNPNVFVHAEIAYGLINKFSELTVDPFLGLRVGEMHDFSAWPPFTDAITSSSTLVDFFSAYIARVPNEANSVEHTLIIGPVEATYCIRRLHRPNVPPIQVTGFACAQYVRLLRSVSGASWDPSLVSFESRFISGIPPDYADIQIRSSGNDGIKIRFPVGWLSRKLKVDFGVAKTNPDQGKEKVTVVAALRSVLKDHLYDSTLGISKAAELLGLEEGRLAKALKRSNTTVAKEHRILRLEAAKAQLRDGNTAIGKIGASIGYIHPGHFTRFFRSQTGMTPIEYRSQAQET